jgi:thiamine biosynthesis lipoprotein
VTPRLRSLAAVGALLALAIVARVVLRGNDGSRIHEFSGITMGTTYTVQMVAGSLEGYQVRDTVQALLDAVDRLMSTHDATSELSRFNRHPAMTPFPVSRQTLEVITVARTVSQLSGGAFDVTVAPLVNAWGFGPSGRPPTAPSETELADLARRVGYQLLTIDSERGALIKADPEIVADLSAIAKGYAVDEVVAALESLGIVSFLVEVGGELKARGRKSDGTAWSVGIELPDADVRTAYKAVPLANMAIATSGDYRNFYEVDGVRYSHIIDPRTHRPARHLGASVSVMHSEAVFADAWATALSVLGPEEGFAVAERERLAALFLIRSGDGFETRETSLLQQLVKASAPR